MARVDRQTICAFPGLRLGDLVGRPVGTGWGWNEAADVRFYYRGAGAVHAAVRGCLGGRPGKILMPAYHCGVEVEAALAAGARVVFYRVDERGLLDPADLESRIDPDVRAVFVIHYFGFPQEVQALRSLCDSRGLLLIEDCAHALGGRLPDGDRLGGFGDVSIFSLGKSLPVPDGGVLRVNRSLPAPCPEAVGRPGRLSTFRGVTTSLLQGVRGRRPGAARIVEMGIERPGRVVLGALKRIPCRACEVTTAADGRLDLDRIRMGMSGMSRRILLRQDEDRIVGRRRANFFFLAERIPWREGMRPLFDELPEGVCPLFFPLVAERRDELRKALGERGVGTFVFGEHLHPALPAGGFPEAESLSRRNLCLPVHQDLSEARLAYVAEVMTGWR